MTKPRGKLRLVKGPKEIQFQGQPIEGPEPVVRLLYRTLLENSELRKKYETLFQQTIYAFMRCIEERDAYTYGHCMRVMEYALLIGRAAELSEQELRNLQLAAMLHDLGKLGIPDCVLLKPGKLNNEENLIIQNHAQKGAAILQLIDAFHDVTPGIHHHHERIDGQGYPDKLSGNQIPLLSRVILVADTFDAMTSTRPYRRALPIQRAYEELERYAGAQFDSDYVTLFLREHKRIHKEHKLIPIPLKKAA